MGREVGDFTPYNQTSEEVVALIEKTLKDVEGVE